jgi:hypothetical protein
VSLETVEPGIPDFLNHDCCLYKVGSKLKGTKKRFFTLDDEHMQQFKEKKDKTSKNKTDLTNATAQL